MTIQRLKPVDTVPALGNQASSGLPYVVIDGVQRPILTTAEFAVHTAHTVSAIRELIKAGKLRVLTGGSRGYLIPVSEIGRIASWAADLDPTT
ncbi:MAG: hypothetical protein ACRDQX_06205 [Pseudonocardiaceae bacterium]